MRIAAAICSPVLAIGLSGCAWQHLTSDSYVHGGNTNRVFVWNSDYSAGIGTEHGICAQGALTATARTAALGAQVADKAKTIDARAAAEYAEAVAALNVSSVQTSYANIAYFYLCQISLNRTGETSDGRLTGNQIEAMFKAVGESAAKINVGASAPVSISSPQAVAVVKEMFARAGIQKDDEEIERELEQIAGNVPNRQLTDPDL